MLDRPKRVVQKPARHNDCTELPTSSSSSGEGMNVNPQPSFTLAQSMDDLRSALSFLQNNTSGTIERDYVSGTVPPISGMPQDLGSFQGLEGLPIPLLTDAKGQEVESSGQAECLQLMETEQQKIARVREEELVQKAQQEAARLRQEELAQHAQQEAARLQQEKLAQQAQQEAARLRQEELAQQAQQEAARLRQVELAQQAQQEAAGRYQQAWREQQDDIEANLGWLHGDGVPPAHLNDPGIMNNNNHNIGIVSAGAVRIPGNVLGDVPNRQNINIALVIQLLQSIQDAQRDHHQYCVNQFRHINNRIDRIGGLIEREPQFPTKPDALPMRTWQSIEEFKAVSDEVFKQIVDYSIDLGGFNLHETANFMVKNAIKYSVSPSLTWQGREPGTLKLQDTKIAKAFHAAASKNKAFGKPTVKKFNDAMTSALKSSKQRNRNRQRG